MEHDGRMPMDQGGAGPGPGEAPSPQRTGVGDAPSPMPRRRWRFLRGERQAFPPLMPRSILLPGLPGIHGLPSPPVSRGKRPSAENASLALLGASRVSLPFSLFLTHSLPHSLPFPSPFPLSFYPSLAVPLPPSHSRSPSPVTCLALCLSLPPGVALGWRRLSWSKPGILVPPSIRRASLEKPGFL